MRRGPRGLVPKPNPDQEIKGRCRLDQNATHRAQLVVGERHPQEIRNDIHKPQRRNEAAPHQVGFLPGRQLGDRKEEPDRAGPTDQKQGVRIGLGPDEFDEDLRGEHTTQPQAQIHHRQKCQQHSNGHAGIVTD